MNTEEDKKERRKLAQKKYASTHAEQMRENSKRYYDKNKDNEDFKNHCREKSLKTYYKKKALKNDLNEQPLTP